MDWDQREKAPPQKKSLEERKASGHHAQITYTDDDLLNEIRDCASELGKTPFPQKFNEWLGMNGAQTITNRFGSWKAACEKAGVGAPPVHRQSNNRKYSEQDIRKAYGRVRAKTDRPPTAKEWTALNGKPSKSHIERMYGGWIPFIERMESLPPVEPEPEPEPHSHPAPAPAPAPAPEKNPMAVALGRRGGLKGGPARAASMTAEERRAIARKAAAARWRH